jgi:hypothetical protein
LVRDLMITPVLTELFFSFKKINLI